MGGGAAGRAAGPDRAARRRVRARLRLDGRQRGADQRRRPAHAAAAVNPVRTSIPVARIADMLLSPGRRLRLQRRAPPLPGHRARLLGRRQPVPPPPGPDPAAQGVPGRDTVVVHEPYWTATARHADIVLPATVTLERDDIGAAPQRPVPHRHAPARAAVRAGPRRLRDLRRRWPSGSGAARRSPRAATPTAGCGTSTTSGARALRRRGPDFDSVLARGAGRARPGRRRQALLADFRADPDAHPLAHAERADRAALGDDRRRSATPTAPATRPGWSRASGSAPRGPPRYPLLLLANNPSARLHSQLDFGPHSAADKVAGREPLRMHPTTPPPAGSSTATSCACSTTAAPAWRACASSDRPAAGRGADVDRRLVLPGR